MTLAKEGIVMGKKRKSAMARYFETFIEILLRKKMVVIAIGRI